MKVGKRLIAVVLAILMVASSVAPLQVKAFEPEDTSRRNENILSAKAVEWQELSEERIGVIITPYTEGEEGTEGMILPEGYLCSLIAIYGEGAMDYDLVDQQFATEGLTYDCTDAINSYMSAGRLGNRYFRVLVMGYVTEEIEGEVESVKTYSAQKNTIGTEYVIYREGVKPEQPAVTHEGRDIIITYTQDEVDYVDYRVQVERANGMWAEADGRLEANGETKSVRIENVLWEAGDYTVQAWAVVNDLGSEDAEPYVISVEESQGILSVESALQPPSKPVWQQEYDWIGNDMFFDVEPGMTDGDVHYQVQTCMNGDTENPIDVQASTGYNYITGQGTIWNATDVFEESGTYQFRVRACYNNEDVYQEGAWSEWSESREYIHPGQSLTTPISEFVTWNEGGFTLNVGYLEGYNDYHYMLMLLREETVELEDGNTETYTYCENMASIWPDDNMQNTLRDIEQGWSWIYDNEGGLFYFTLQVMSNIPYEIGHGDVVVSGKHSTQIDGPAVTVDEQNPTKVQLSAPGATAFEWEVYMWNAEAEEYHHVHGDYAEAIEGVANLDLYHHMYENTNYLINAVTIIETEDSYKRSAVAAQDWDYIGHPYLDVEGSGVLDQIDAETIRLGNADDNYTLSFQAVQGQFGDETHIWYEYGLVYTDKDKSGIDVGTDIETNPGDYHDVTVVSDHWRNPGTGIVRADFFTDNFEGNGTYYVRVKPSYDDNNGNHSGEWSDWACIGSYTNPKNEADETTYLTTPANTGSWSAEREGYFNFNVGEEGLAYGNRYRVKLLYSVDGQEFRVAERRVFNNTWDGIEQMENEFNDYADQFFNNISWQQGIYKIAVQAVSENPYEEAHGQWVESEPLDVRLAAPKITVPAAAVNSQFMVGLAAEGATGFEWELYRGEINNDFHVYGGYVDAENGAAEIDLYHCMYGEAAEYILIVRSVRGERRSEDETSNWTYAGHALLSPDIALTQKPTFSGWSEDEKMSLQFQAAVGEFENYIEYKYELKRGEELATAVEVDVLPQAWRDTVTGVVNYEYFRDNYTESGTYWARVIMGYHTNNGYVTNEECWSDWVQIGTYEKPDNTLPAPAATGEWSAEAGEEGLFIFNSEGLNPAKRYRLLLWYQPNENQAFEVCDGNIFRETWDESGEKLRSWFEENTLIFKENYISRNSGKYYYTLQSLSDTPDMEYHSPLKTFEVGTYTVEPPQIEQNGTEFTVSASNVWGYWWDLVRIKDENGDDTEGYYSDNKYVEADNGTAHLDLADYLWDKGTYELRVRSNGVDTNNKYEFTFEGKPYLDKELALVTPGKPQWRYHDESDTPDSDTMYLEYYVEPGMFNWEVSYEVQLKYIPEGGAEQITNVLFGNGADYATGVGGSYNIISNFAESGSYSARARVKVWAYVAEEDRHVENFSDWSEWSDTVAYTRPTEQLETPNAGVWSDTTSGLIEFSELQALAEGERYLFIWHYQTDIGEEEQLRNWYSYGYEDTNGAADVLNWINDRQEEISWNKGIHKISVQKMSSNPYTVASGEVHISAEYDNRAEARIAGATASLEGNIVLNFYVKVKEGISADSLFVDMFRCEVGSEEDYYILLRENVELAKEPFDENSGCYVVSYPIAAKEMTDVIKVNLRVDKDENETYEIDHIDYSVKLYAEDVLSRTEDDNTKKLVKAMLNYGAYAQKYFGYKYNPEDTNAADSLANAVVGMTEDDKNEAVNINEADLITQLTSAGHVRKVTNAAAVTGLTYYGSTANMESDTGMVHMFSLDGSSAIGDYTFTCGGNLSTFRYQGNYCVEIENILAQDLDEKKTIAVTDESNNTMTIDYSIYAYINNILSKEGTGEEMANLAKALYLYGEAANAYAAPVVTGE